jgi:hypothetical protein
MESEVGDYEGSNLWIGTVSPKRPTRSKELGPIGWTTGFCSVPLMIPLGFAHPVGAF